MSMNLRYLEGKPFCVVMLEDSDAIDPEKVKVRPILGRANVDKTGILKLEYDGGSFVVPSSSYPGIQPSDDTDILAGSEYFVIVKVSGMKI